MTEKARKWQF